LHSPLNAGVHVLPAEPYKPFSEADDAQALLIHKVADGFRVAAEHAGDFLCGEQIVIRAH
jgi:hypothetical protein